MHGTHFSSKKNQSLDTDTERMKGTAFINFYDLKRQDEQFGGK